MMKVLVGCATAGLLLPFQSLAWDYSDLTLEGLNRHLRSGGPGIDGIPAMTNPDAVLAHQVEYVQEEDLVLGVVIGGEAKAYPHNLGWWHEIVNDRISDTFISVTLCPLTGTGLVFAAEDEAGHQLEFGVSGLLINSNLVMYDRRDENTLIPQMIYTAISGQFESERLELLPVVETTWANWKQMHPDTRVAQFGTGLDRYDPTQQSRYFFDRYTIYPYGEYRTDNQSLLFLPSTTELSLSYNPVAAEEGVSQIKELVLGICSDEETKAYPFATVPSRAVINDQVGDTELLVVFDQETATAIPYNRRVDDNVLTFYEVEEEEQLGELDLPEFADVETGSHWNMLGEAIAGPLEGSRLRQLPAYNSMWFGWASFWPNTQIWDGEGLIEKPPLVTGVEEELVLRVPEALALEQNYPNPFNPQTQIQFTIPFDGWVNLRVYNNAGQLVSELAGGHRSAGRYLVKWDGRNDRGDVVASGHYVYRLELVGRGLVRSRVMTLVR